MLGSPIKMTKYGTRIDLMSPANSVYVWTDKCIVKIWHTDVQKRTVKMALLPRQGLASAVPHVQVTLGSQKE